MTSRQKLRQYCVDAFPEGFDPAPSKWTPPAAPPDFGGVRSTERAEPDRLAPPPGRAVKREPDSGQLNAPVDELDGGCGLDSLGGVSGKVYLMNEDRVVSAREPERRPPGRGSATGRGRGSGGRGGGAGQPARAGVHAPASLSGRGEDEWGRSFTQTLKRKADADPDWEERKPPTKRSQLSRRGTHRRPGETAFRAAQPSNRNMPEREGPALFASHPLPPCGRPPGTARTNTGAAPPVATQGTALAGVASQAPRPDPLHAATQNPSSGVYPAGPVPMDLNTARNASGLGFTAAAHQRAMVQAAATQVGPLVSVLLEVVEVKCEGMCILSWSLCMWWAKGCLTQGVECKYHGV
jgi:hypothetical protein